MALQCSGNGTVWTHRNMSNLTIRSPQTRVPRIFTSCCRLTIQCQKLKKGITLHSVTVGLSEDFINTSHVLLSICGTLPYGRVVSTPRHQPQILRAKSSSPSLPSRLSGLQHASWSKRLSRSEGPPIGRHRHKNFRDPNGLMALKERQPWARTRGFCHERLTQQIANCEGIWTSLGRLEHDTI